MELSAKETGSIIRYYSEQKRRLLGEMKHVEQVLRKLKGQSQDEATGVLLTQTGQQNLLVDAP